VLQWRGRVLRVPICAKNCHAHAEVVRRGRCMTLREPMSRKFILVFVAACSLPHVAHGQSNDADAVRAEADRLFEEARVRMKQGSVTEACKLFSESYELLPRPGTELNLAVCLERRGDNVLAFRHFRRALTAARAAGRADREQLAEKHLTELAAKLAWVELARSGESNGLVVLIDGTPITHQIDERIPVESGEHILTFEAPGRPAQRIKLDTSGGRTYVVNVPAVSSTAMGNNTRSATRLTERLPRPVPNASRDVYRRPGVHPAWGIGTLGLGTLALVTGGVFGWRALEAGQELQSACPGSRCTSGSALRRAEELRLRGEKAALVANVGLPLGALLGVAGIYALSKGERANIDTPPRRPVAGIGLQAGRNVAGFMLETSW
jgi:hypothetical protein